MKKILTILVLILCIILLILSLFLYNNRTYYSADSLSIQEISSHIDYDQDGIDDYHDIVLSARTYIESNPTYKSVYYDGGYPTDEYGVCTDVVIQGFLGAGYSIKDMIDQDIQLHKKDYHIEHPDPNIDFRRVRNLNVFFSKYALSLTTELTDPNDWQPGDIIVYKKHIALCSDRRNRNGYPFIMHHDPLGPRERNELTSSQIVAHYRWKEKSERN